LAFQLIFLLARRAKEISDRIIIAVSGNLRIPAIRAVNLAGNPVLREYARALQSADVRRSAARL
jgi:hypothetical protein